MSSTVRVHALVRSRCPRNSCLDHCIFSQNSAGFSAQLQIWRREEEWCPDVACAQVPWQRKSGGTARRESQYVMRNNEELSECDCCSGGERSAATEIINHVHHLAASIRETGGCYMTLSRDGSTLVGRSGPMKGPNHSLQICSISRSFGPRSPVL